MKNERDTFRALFEEISLDGEDAARMEQKILKEAELPRKTVRRIRPGMLAAAVLVLTLCLTAISAAPAVRKHFFPGVGVVEVTDEEAAPLYLILNTDGRPAEDTELLAGYWHNGTAKAWFRSETRYEDIAAEALSAGREAVLSLEYVSTEPNPERYIQTYSLTFPDITWEDASEGLPFGNGFLYFSQMPAEYRPYILEQSGLRLTLIPMTEDYTVFAAEISGPDGRDGIRLVTKTHYVYQNNDPAMYLADENGCLYPLKKYPGSDVFTIDGTPSAPITGFHADYIAFKRDFSGDNLSTVVTVPLPAEGESTVLDMDFTFPDGVTKGRIHAIGYCNPITEEQNIDREAEFPLGYLSVITEALEQDGIRYWFEMTYTEEYHRFLEQYTVMEPRSPYDLTPMSPLAPKTRLSMEGLTNQIHRTEHYIADGSGTVDLAASWYYGIAPGDWNIDFGSVK